MQCRTRSVVGFLLTFAVLLSGTVFPVTPSTSEAAPLTEYHPGVGAKILIISGWYSSSKVCGGDPVPEQFCNPYDDAGEIDTPSDQIFPGGTTFDIEEELRRIDRELREEHKRCAPNGYKRYLTYDYNYVRVYANHPEALGGGRKQVFSAQEGLMQLQEHKGKFTHSGLSCDVAPSVDWVQRNQRDFLYEWLDAPDGDGDTIADHYDGCEEEAGPVSNNGCPEGPGETECETYDLEGKYRHEFQLPVIGSISLPVSDQIRVRYRACWNDDQVWQDLDPNVPIENEAGVTIVSADGSSLFQPGTERPGSRFGDGSSSQILVSGVTLVFTPRANAEYEGSSLTNDVSMTVEMDVSKGGCARLYFEKKPVDSQRC